MWQCLQDLIYGNPKLQSIHTVWIWWNTKVLDITFFCKYLIYDLRKHFTCIAYKKPMVTLSWISKEDKLSWIVHLCVVIMSWFCFKTYLSDKRIDLDSSLHTGCPYEEQFILIVTKYIVELNDIWFFPLIKYLKTQNMFGLWWLLNSLMLNH